MKRVLSHQTGRMVARALGCIIMVLVAVFAGFGTGATVHAEDLMTVYRQAVGSSPILKGSKALLESDRAFHRAALSALMPRLNTNAAIDRDQAKITGFGKDFGASPLIGSAFGDITDTYYGGSYSVTLAQPLVNGQAWAGLQATKQQVRAGEASVKATEQDLILKVTAAYFGVLNARAVERVARGQQHLLREILDQARANLKVGTGDIISLKEAQARYDAAESGCISAHNAVEIAVQELQRLTHQPVGEIDDLGRIVPQGPNPDQVDPWQASAEENQPLLTQARAQLAAAGEKVEIERRSRWPNLYLTAGYGYSKGDFLPSVETQKSQIGLTFNLPLYEGGEIAAQVARARAQEAASRYRLDDLKDQVSLNTRSAFLNLKNSVSRLNASAQALESAKTSLDATRKGYEIGARSIIDLLTSAQDYEKVHLDYFQSLYDHVLARARLKWAAGVINQKDVAAINALLSHKDH